MQTVWNRINTALLVLVLLMLAGALAKGVYGGPMDPSAPPASTLPQVEPRIPISQPALGGFPIVISQPGSYFLTQNITGEASSDGIQISTGGVTLDLNGFTVQGVYGSLAGVRVSGGLFREIKIHSGNVIGWGGVGIDMGTAFGGEITGVGVNGNGADGVVGGSNWITVSDSWVSENSGNGINTGSFPVFVSNSKVGANLGNGIVAGSRSTVEDTTVGYNSLNGILVSGGIITRNVSDYNGQDGIRVTAGPCLIADNTASINGAVGIDVQSSGCEISRNRAGGNTGGNYVTVLGDDVGPIGSAATSTSPWANISN